MGELWNAWGQPMLGIIEIGLLLAAVYLTIAQFRRSRASSYIERFNSSEILASRVAVDRWLRENPTNAERLAAAEADPELAAQVRQFANLFQELGAAYQLRVVHRKSVRRLFDSLVVMYWERLRFWILEYRARTDPTLYARFEYLYRQLEDNSKPATKQATYVVAYGSLMDPASIGAALGRSVSPAELIPVHLLGFRRAWTVAETVRMEGDSESTTAAFLDLVRDPEASVQAAMVRVDHQDMVRLEAREKHYRATDVSSSVRLTGDTSLRPGAKAVTFLGLAEHYIDPSDGKPVILKRYVDRVVSAASTLGDAAVLDVTSTADSTGLPVLPGPYTFVDPAQARLV